MSEATEHVMSKSLALEQSHAALGAGFRDEDGWRVPATYGKAESEYSAVRELGIGLIDLSSRGRLRVTGTEAIMFLNGLITNDMKTLGENRWMPAVFPTVQGRIIAPVRIAHVDNGYLIDTEPVTHERILKTLERFTLAGDFRVEDLADTTSMLTVQGKAPEHVLRTVFDWPNEDLDRIAAGQISSRGEQVTFMRATHTGEDGFDLVISNENAPALWDALIDAGARPVGYDALEMLRIEAGIARYGRDMDETNVVTETNLDDAVSFTKGCYIGQEIIVRIKHRGHVAKKLTGLMFDQVESIEAGAVIKTTDGKDIGRITSSTVSPVLGKTVALGYVRYEYLSPGTRVEIHSSDQKAAATVHDLPFVRGSWH
jgi:folate-binding protein YgfZ